MVKAIRILAGLGALIFCKAAQLINLMLSLIGFKIIRKSIADEVLGYSSKASFSKELPLPQGARNYLQPNNPRLRELRARYHSLRRPVTAPSWWSRGLINKELDLEYFRGDNVYLYQIRGRNTEAKYLLSTYYIQKIDKLGLLSKLSEDGLFGAYLFDFNGEFCVSRDLLDSIAEFYFLERNLGISTLPNIKLLDIGAGYGRLAHRMTGALPNIEKYFCVDGVAESTFICEYYLRFRGKDDKAEVVPFYEVEKVLSQNTVNIAVNIHSFSECTMDAICWWFDLLKNNKVKYLMIAPNSADHGGNKLLSFEKGGACLDFMPALAQRGYTLIAKQPKYLDASVQKYGVSPTWHYLFELKP